MKLVEADGPALGQILDQTHPIWSDGLSRSAYERFNEAQRRTPWGRDHLRRFLLIDDDGRVLSTAKRYDLRARLDGREIGLVGLGAVFTPPEARGHGHAAVIVDRLVEAARRDGAELAVLFSEIDPAFYAASGFVAIPRCESLLRVRPSQGAPMVMVRDGTDADVPAIVALAGRMSAGHRFALTHSDALVRYGLSRKRLLAGFLASGDLAVEFYVVEEGGGAVAFAMITVTETDAVLEMCGDRDPSGARVGALLQTLRARTPGARMPPLTGFLPHGWCPPQVEIEEGTLARAVMMVRPLREGVLDVPLTERDVLFWHGDLF
jgi:GNAT superfamily N-acetyltransferase